MAPPVGLLGLASGVGSTGRHVILVSRFTGGRWGAAALLSLAAAAAAVAVRGASWAWVCDGTGSPYGPSWSHAPVDVGLMGVGYDILFGLP